MSLQHIAASTRAAYNSLQSIRSHKLYTNHQRHDTEYYKHAAILSCWMRLFHSQVLLNMLGMSGIVVLHYLQYCWVAYTVTLKKKRMMFIVKEKENCIDDEIPIPQIQSQEQFTEASQVVTILFLN